MLSQHVSGVVSTLHKIDVAIPNLGLDPTVLHVKMAHTASRLRQAIPMAAQASLWILTFTNPRSLMRDVIPRAEDRPLEIPCNSLSPELSDEAV